MSDKTPPRRILALTPSYNWSAQDIAQTRMNPYCRVPHIELPTGVVIHSPVTHATVLAEYVARTLNTEVVIEMNDLVKLEKYALNAILICNSLKARMMYALIQKIKRKA